MIHPFRVKRADEVKKVTLDFTQDLDSDELLLASPTVAERHSADLTISGAATNDAALGSIAVSKAVTFFVEGGTSGNEYTVRATVTSDDGQILVKDITFRVI